MATLMDISLIGYFGPLFLFLLAFIIVYAFLISTKMFDKLPGKNGIAAIIALTLGFFILMFKPAALLISSMVPWFAVLIILLFLIMFSVKMFDQSEDLFAKVLGAKAVHWTLITIFIIIVISSLSYTFGQSLLEKQVGDNLSNVSGDDVYEEGNEPTTTQSPSSTATASRSFGDNVLMTIINPRVLGMILLLIIGVFTIIFMADSQSTKL
jgi:hypothetical protein